MHFVFPYAKWENEIKVSTSVCTGRCKPPAWLADMIRIPLHSEKNGTRESGHRFFGGDGGIRTLDLTDANRTLSQLSYAPKSSRSIIIAQEFFIVKKKLIDSREKL